MTRFHRDLRLESESDQILSFCLSVFHFIADEFAVTADYPAQVHKLFGTYQPIEGQTPKILHI